MSQPATVAPATVHSTSFTVLLAVSFCHFLNDMMQALLPAIYPMIKTGFDLNFTQIGLVAFVFHCTASLLQPAIGWYADRRPMPFSLPFGMLFTLCGMLLLSVAGNYAVLLIAAGLVGMGSSVFHPESSRVARMASGPRPGLAQSVFQVGGNFGTAIGPLAAALVVGSFAQARIALYALVALVAILVLWNVGIWYKNHGLQRMKSQAQNIAHLPKLSDRRIKFLMGVLVLLIFSKHFYMASMISYYTFFLIHKFQVSVLNAQIHLFMFLGAVAVGTLLGGPVGDRFGRKYVIWFSVLAPLPFTLILPDANLFWTGVLSMVIGVILASAFSAIVVYGQELMPGKVGMVSGLFFGMSFGVAGVGAAVMGYIADLTSIEYVYRLCSFLPLLGLLAIFLPNIKPPKKTASGA